MPPTSATPPARPNRRYFRFTLRLLLATLTLLCLVLGLWTHRAREQRRIVERIQSVGGVVIYDYQLDFEGPSESWQQPCVPEWILSTLGKDFFQSVRSVSLHNIPCDRSLVADVARLIGLIEFNVYVEQLTDNDLAPIAGASNLQTLHVNSSHNYYRGLEIGDSSLEIVGQLPALKSVSIDGRQITKRGLAGLARVRTLNSVAIHGVDDDVASYVDELFDPKVKNLQLMRTPWPSDGSMGVWRLSIP